MRDFTLEAYEAYLRAMQATALPFIGFPEAIEGAPDEFVLLRHDVDRRPGRSLAMAQLESDLGAKATYYFRAKPSSFDAQIIQQIAALGHDIGYHYECLSDADGDFVKALEIFQTNLEQFRALAEIRTISMHGRPFSPYDNRDLWLEPENKALLGEWGVLGEIYHAVDYTEIAYVNDTGRNWMSNESNLRDHVASEIPADFADHQTLLAYFENPACRKIVFQVHPERWHDGIVPWAVQLGLDTGINVAKKIISGIRSR